MNRIRNIKPQELTECLRIFHQAFSDTELRSDGRIRALYDQGRMKFACLEAGGRIVSCQMYWPLKDLLFLENFATRPGRRGQGYGGELLEHMKNIGRPLVLEAEEGTDEMSRRRIAFYERHGLVLSGQEYYLPPLQKGAPVQFYRLMTCGCEADEALVHRLYREVYDSGRTLADYRRQFVEKNGVCAYTR